MNNKLYIGVDIGSESLRVGAFNQKGKLLIKSVRSITIFNQNSEYYEQSSEEIWCMFLEAFQEIIFRLKKGNICGLGFATTCSLVVLDKLDRPLAVHDGGPNHQNIIMWMDHRAVAEASLINSTHDRVLDSVGGAISVEMEVPKILWMKKNLSHWTEVGKVMDLSDYVRWRATGTLSRSICAAVCKWNYQSSPNFSLPRGTKHRPSATVDNGGGSVDSYWPESFYRRIGLDPQEFRDLLGLAGPPYQLDEVREGAKDASLFDRSILSQMGLPDDKVSCCDIVVGPAMVDAQAGTIGLLACHVGTDDSNDALDESLEEYKEYYDSLKVSQTMKYKLALITGTSNCLMAISDTSIPVPGVWGPYYSVIFPGKFVSEGGQSASGQSLGYLRDRFFLNAKSNHSMRRRRSSQFSQQQQYHQLQQRKQSVFKSPYDTMVTTLMDMADDYQISGKGIPRSKNAHSTNDNCDVAHRLFGTTQSASKFFDFTRHLHVLPDFNGNRSPLADPTVRAMIVGLDLDETLTGAARLYLATLQSLALGIRRIIEAMNDAGHSIKLIHAGGGLCQNNLLPKIVADVTGLPVILSENQSNCVMLGAAILASFSSHTSFKTVQDAMEAMSCRGDLISPSPLAKSFYDRKYQVFLKMYRDQSSYRQTMAETNTLNEKA